LTLLSKLKTVLGLTLADAPLISVVLHFRKALTLSDETLHQAVTRAWGRDVSKDLNEYIATKSLCFIKFEEIVLLLTNTRKPYCPQQYIEQALAEFPELRQKKIVKEHRAFLSIDLLTPKSPGRSAKNGCYRRMCRLAAEFVDDNCMGVYFPETGHLRPYDSEVKDALRSESPLREVTKWGLPPVMPIEADDPRLQAAVGQARRDWLAFVHAFQNGKPNESFGVKAFFTDGKCGEWMWIAVSSIDGEAVRGNLGNTPVDVTGIKEGDPVTVQASEIGDWVYSDGKKLVGGFSLALDEG
jgi:uncharacterized protein YegJ (DUF2314 family)